MKENAKLASEIDQKIERIKTEVIYFGNILLKKVNIQQLEVLLDDQKDKNLLKKFINKLPD